MAKMKYHHLLTCMLSALLMLALHSCKEKVQEDIIPSSEYAAYVNAYAGGIISQLSTIRVGLVSDVPVVELDTELTNNPFTFSPPLKGKAYWVNNNTIEFVPEEGALKPGQIYKTVFKLGDYVQVEKGMEKFEFTFRVMERNFRLNMDAIKVDQANPQLATLPGTIRFSDAVTLQQVEKMLTAETDSKQNLSVVVQPTDDPAIFRFAVNNISKKDSQTQVKVIANGKPIGVDNIITRTAIIPALSDFSYLSAEKVADAEGGGIRLVFSEAIAPSQNLDGLISIPEISVKPTFRIEDNMIYVYIESEKTHPNITLNIYQGIQSADGRKLSEVSTVSFIREAISPQVQLLHTGTILPDSKNLILNFKAVSLHAVDLSVVRIFENNVLSFLQTNTLGSSDELRRSGRLIYKKTLQLDADATKDVTQWENYSIDLSGLISQEPGAIYRVMLSFKQEYSAYPCESGSGSKLVSGEAGQMMNTLNAPESEELDDAIWDVPYAYYNMEYGGYNWQVYEWEQRDNPCHPSYYMPAERRASCNVLATNLGVIAKMNSANTVWATVNNILDTTPVDMADVTVYNYQLQPIGSGTTNPQGFAEITCKGIPFALIATDGQQKTYLRMVDGEENSVSRFDTGGKEIRKGLKGYTYGERGVWRPGDTLHVSFILEDAHKRIPDKHPVSFELYNPRGQFYTKLVSTNGVNGFYIFQVPTHADDPTGMWNAYIKVGGASFHKSFRIETVKPNRLKINLKVPGDMLKASQGSVNLELSSTWLTGATASNLKAKVEMSLAKRHTQFKDYSRYIFNDPSAQFTSSKIDVFEGSLNSEGNATFKLEIPESENAPGMLQANITTRVFEPGGDASINTISVPLSPYDAYVGINLNQPDNRYIETDTDHVFDIVTVNADGKPVNRRNLEYKIYRVGWYWWWENRNESFSSYINNSTVFPAASGKLTTVNGKAQFKFRVDYPGWGRYLVYVKDKDSGHATGGTIYIDWPSWRGRSDKTDPSGITMLSFSVDKESYEVGETVTAIIPTAAEGRALIAIENGSKVLSRDWLEVSSSGDTKYQFTVTPEMAPNVYLHITLLQPHAQTVNDLPIRMYGVVPVFVSNKETVLEPQIRMPDVLRPEQEFAVAVNEKSGKPMTYTLAIVDDGLLDLTNFKTPNPWDEFYAREALGIRTWDMYDQVIGAYSGVYSSLFSTGGDEMLKQDDAKANRFRPVVKFLGPFTLDKGGSNTHKIMLPMYVGSVRTMIVSGQDGAYGKAEKTTPVRSPLMVLSTLPRVLSIGEEILLPVNVFAMEDDVKNVSVSIETSPNLSLTDGNKKSVSFSKTGDKLVFFKLKTSDVTGIANVKITATSGSHTTNEAIEIDIRNPNPVVTTHESKLIDAGKTAQVGYALGADSKENWVKLEVSRIPTVDISRRLDYLYNYYHSCTEQITSKALPLLFINQFKETDGRELEIMKMNVREAIKQLYSRQLPNGGMIFWPGNAVADEWITSYAGMFMVLAREKGYDVNNGVLNKWKSFQRSAVKNWVAMSRDPKRNYWQSDLQQAFRLYTLALAGSPELGAMNRMKELKGLSMQAKWRLAAAYALAGKTSAANELIFNEVTDVTPYSSYNSVYGSAMRDEAMILETLVLMGKDKEAFIQAQKLSRKLNSENYFSTQSTAFSLMAMGRLAEQISGSLDFRWSVNGRTMPEIKSTKALYQAEIAANPLSGSVEIKNNGEGMIYADLISRTQLLKDTLPAIANNLKVEVEYTDMTGKALDITKLKQGTDFMAVVKVSNISGSNDYQDIALTHMIPSGWEIYNERMIVADDSDTSVASEQETYSYRDIRDDRVLTYFDLRSQTSIKVRVRLQATYAGTYVLPAIQCEAMYDVLAQGRTRAGKVIVER